ncbi:hypothetical protein Tco_1047143 [Tanacetum coccineum]
MPLRRSLYGTKGDRVVVRFVRMLVVGLDPRELETLAEGKIMVLNGFEVVAKSEQRAVVAVEYDEGWFYGTFFGISVMSEDIQALYHDGYNKLRSQTDSSLELYEMENNSLFRSLCTSPLHITLIASSSKEWMRRTTEHYIIIDVLITNVAFAAAYTVLGVPIKKQVIHFSRSLSVIMINVIVNCIYTFFTFVIVDTHMKLQ